MTLQQCLGNEKGVSAACVCPGVLRRVLLAEYASCTRTFTRLPAAQGTCESNVCRDRNHFQDRRLLGWKVCIAHC